MAITIPTSIPDKASEGEKRFFRICATKLPDNYYIWYEPSINNKYPDFIILAPDFGLLVIEVKGWYGNNIIAANSDIFTIEKQAEDYDTTEQQKSPLRQGKDYLDNLLNSLKKYPILTQEQGKYQGNLAFPVGCGAIMSNITLAQAEKLNINSVLTPPLVAYRDELLNWENDDFSALQLINRLKEMFKVRFPFSPLTQAQIDTIKGIIYPEIVIRKQKTSINSVAGDLSLLPNDKILITLDNKQEDLAKTIGDGHRIFFGVAGSGKTLLLLARAKILINQNPQAKILIICFNVSLASYLKSLLSQDVNNPQYLNIQVINFDQWAKLILGKLPAKVEGNRDEYIANLVLNQLNSYEENQLWDAILIDEAHTFIPQWFQCCVKALKYGENGDLMIVADGSQGVYQRDKFTWKEVGIKAQGRTISKKFDLDRNYRNTVEILNAAWSFLQKIQTKQEVLETEETTFPAIKPETAVRHGNKPQVYGCDTLDHQQLLVIKTIQNLTNNDFNLENIAILYRQKNGNQLEKLMLQMEQLAIPYYWITKDATTKSNYSYDHKGVRIITCLSSLGLEFKVVLIIWLEQFDDCVSNTQGALMNTRQLYVAMTRCQNKLFLFSLKNSKIIKELEGNQYFETNFG